MPDHREAPERASRTGPRRVSNDDQGQNPVDPSATPPERPLREHHSSKATPEQAAIDADLMRRVAAGNEAAVAALYDRFGSLVYRMAFQVMPSRSEADDAVQEVFVRLWRTADRYDAEKAALVTWVMLIARRHLVDKLRRTRTRVSAVQNEESATWAAPGGDGSASRLERDERFAALFQRIEGLPELQRTVVIRAYLGGQTLRQIGLELNTPLGTIKSALSRALVRLRERVDEEIAL